MSTFFGLAALFLFVAVVLIIGMSLMVAAKRGDGMTDECDAILRKLKALEK